MTLLVHHSATWFGCDHPDERKNRCVFFSRGHVRWRHPERLSLDMCRQNWRQGLKKWREWFSYEIYMAAWLCLHHFQQWNWGIPNFGTHMSTRCPFVRLSLHMGRMLRGRGSYCESSFKPLKISSEERFGNSGTKPCVPATVVMRVIA